MAIPVQEKNGIVVINFSGKIDIRLRKAVHDILEDKIANKKNLFLCNFSNVEFVDSSGLGILISMIKKVSVNSGQLKICCVNNAIMELLRLSHLLQVFDIYETVDEAIESFQV